LGVKAVIAESYERIHRSNLVGMGVLPLQFLPGQNRETIGLTGLEQYTISGLGDAIANGSHAHVHAGDRKFEAIVRIDTPQEVEYYRNGGILPYVLRQLVT